MQRKDNEIDFSNQKIFIGIDVHKRQWTIAVRVNGIPQQPFSMNPSPDQLHRYLSKNYRGGDYYSVYEAGFSGFWIDRRLHQLGIKNIIVNPADIPTKNKERINRNDRVDAMKLAKTLENEDLTANYIPTEFQQELRSLCRLRFQQTKDLSRIKNRIKGLLLFYGKPIPENQDILHWSDNFIKYLEGIKFSTEMGNETLARLLQELKTKKNSIAATVKSIRTSITKYELKGTINNLTSVPGVGFITAINLYTELIDINRFDTIDKLCSYVGLIPSVDSSDEKENVRGMSNRHIKFLRNIVIEAAWVAIRKDPVLLQKYNKLTLRMSKQKAIIRIAKKLLSRIWFVWKNKKQYEHLIVN